MKAVILCGGFAKRMWPLTKDTPKQLLEVAEEKAEYRRTLNKEKAL